jgi:hypothetical protein
LVGCSLLSAVRFRRHRKKTFPVVPHRNPNTRAFLKCACQNVHVVTEMCMS